jgi:hypothetical protein
VEGETTTIHLTAEDAGKQSRAKFLPLIMLVDIEGLTPVFLSKNFNNFRKLNGLYYGTNYSILQSELWQGTMPSEKHAEQCV